MFALMALVGCGGDDDTSQDPIVGADAAPAVDAGTEAPPPPAVDAAPGMPAPPYPPPGYP